MTESLLYTYQACVSFLKQANLDVELHKESLSQGYDLYCSTLVAPSGRKYSGYSLGATESAFKSTIEATERFLIERSAGFKSSTGFSLSCDLDFAKNRAEIELIERDNIANFLSRNSSVYGEEVVVAYPSWVRIKDLSLKSIKITNSSTKTSYWFLNLTKSGIIHSWGSCVDNEFTHGLEEAVMAAIVKDIPTKFHFDKLHFGFKQESKPLQARPEITFTNFTHGNLNLVKAQSKDLLDYSLGIKVNNTIVYSVDQHLDSI